MMMSASRSVAHNGDVENPLEVTLVLGREAVREIANKAGAQRRRVVNDESIVNPDKDPQAWMRRPYSFLLFVFHSSTGSRDEVAGVGDGGRVVEPPVGGAGGGVGAGDAIGELGENVGHACCSRS